MQPLELAVNPADEPLDDETLALMCKALSHPARVKILQYLRQVDRCICGELVQILPLAQSTVSQHLKCLKQAGLIGGEVDGPAVCYCVDNHILEKFKTAISRL